MTQSALVLLILSWVGKCVKPRHQILSNFLIMMSLLEHLSIIAQVILAFAYGGAAWGFVALIIWAVYCIIQFLFWRDFRKEIIDKDGTFRKWREAKNNAWTKRIIDLLGTFVSWRFYKLLYSHYFGYSIKTTDFSDSKRFQ